MYTISVCFFLNLGQKSFIVCKVAVVHLPLKHGGAEMSELFPFCSIDKLCFVNAKVQSFNRLPLCT